MVIMGSSVPGRVSRCRPAWRKYMISTIRLVSTIIFIGLSETNTIGYERYLAAEQHQVGKENTQRIESKHINLRTRIKRLVRRTLCFSKTERMHDLVIGLFINRYEFGQPV